MCRPRLQQIAITVLALALLGAQPASASASSRAGRVIVLRPHRSGLAGPSEIWVYRPPVNDSARLPVFYYLHGNPGGPSELFRAGLRGLMDRYIAKGGRPFVIAAPDGNSSRHGDTEWGDASDGTDFVESFFLRTVVPKVEGRYPRDASHRAIGGFSMGAFGAMNIALQHPELFSQICSVAGYFSLDDPSHIFATAQSQLLNTPSNNVAAARGKRILLLDAQDERLSLVRGQSAVFDAALAREGIPAALYVARGDHDPSYEIRQMPVIAHFLSLGWSGT